MGAALLASCAPLHRPTGEGPPLPAPAVPPAPPPAVEAPPPPAPAPPAASAVPRRREREQRALELVHQDELARALVEWKILCALDPDNAEYRRQVAAVQALVRHRFEQHLGAGDQARAAGHPERAQLAYLKALALDPLRTEPLSRLRELDRERALAAQSGRLAKLRGRQGDGSADKKGSPPAQAAGQQERDYLETGISLLRQGAYEEGILELEKYLRSFPDDPEARGHLAEARRKLSDTPGAASPPAPAGLRPAAPPPEAPPPAAAPAAPSAAEPPAPAAAAPADKALAQELYEKGMRVSRTDLDQAIRLWEEALARDPEHVQARLQLERALRMQRSLQEIPAR